MIKKLLTSMLISASFLSAADIQEHSLSAADIQEHSKVPSLKSLAINALEKFDPSYYSAPESCDFIHMIHNVAEVTKDPYVVLCNLYCSNMSLNPANNSVYINNGSRNIYVVGTNAKHAIISENEAAVKGATVYLKDGKAIISYTRVGHLSLVNLPDVSCSIETQDVSLAPETQYVFLSRIGDAIATNEKIYSSDKILIDAGQSFVLDLSSQTFEFYSITADGLKESDYCYYPVKIEKDINLECSYENIFKQRSDSIKCFAAFSKKDPGILYSLFFSRDESGISQTLAKIKINSDKTLEVIFSQDVSAQEDISVKNAKIVTTKNGLVFTSITDRQYQTKLLVYKDNGDKFNFIKNILSEHNVIDMYDVASKGLLFIAAKDKQNNSIFSIDYRNCDYLKIYKILSNDLIALNSSSQILVRPVDAIDPRKYQILISCNDKIIGCDIAII